MLFLYEIKKIIKNKNFIMLLILFVVIDIACIFAKCSNYISDTDKTYYKELKITNEYEGILTSEKVDSITENYERLSRIISYGYSTDYDENTYTGYQMLDYYVYSSLNDELSRIYNFQNDIAEKTNSIKLKAEFFARNGNYTLSKQYTKTASPKTQTKGK